MQAMTSFGPRARLAADLPAHYPGTPEAFSDVSDESLVPLAEVLAAVCEEDIKLINQVRRFRGAWLIARADDHDHKIHTASRAFINFMKYPEGELIGHNCGKLQASDRARNAASNAKLSAAFKNNEDVHVNLRNYTFDGEPFNNSLTIVVLRDSNGKPVYHLGTVIMIAL